jgi:hypothetical protein
MKTGREASTPYDKALHAAVAAHGGTVVLLGSPGLGKSRLISELGRRLGDGATVVAARRDATGGRAHVALPAPAGPLRRSPRSPRPRVPFPVSMIASELASPPAGISPSRSAPLWTAPQRDRDTARSAVLFVTGTK